MYCISVMEKQMSELAPVTRLSRSKVFSMSGGLRVDPQTASDAV